MRELLFTTTIKDCEVQTFRAGGKGGQNQNKVESGVRIIHRPSGAIGESREYRDQLHNKRAAFRRMGESQAFQRWARNKAAELFGRESLEVRVEKAMAEENLKIEGRTENGWEVLAP